MALVVRIAIVLRMVIVLYIVIVLHIAVVLTNSGRTTEDDHATMLRITAVLQIAFVLLVVGSTRVATAGSMSYVHMTHFGARAWSKNIPKQYGIFQPSINISANRAHTVLSGTHIIYILELLIKAWGYVSQSEERYVLPSPFTTILDAQI
jgi:hypothetical protein